MTGLRPELSAALSVLYPGLRHETLSGDASTRRFHRLFVKAGVTRIVMDYGASFAGETDDVRLARIFEQASLPVAKVYEVLPEAGALVLEDLGDGMLKTDRQRLTAVELAADIATRGTDALLRSDRAGGPALDAERFGFEMRFFLENFVGRYLGRPDPGSRVTDSLLALAGDAASHPRVLCHRDYHSRNIMVRPDGCLALVDIQDARWGPDTYDLASLLRDAYADLPERLVGELFEVYRRRLPGPPDATALRSRFDLVGAQRMIKALGTFGYQVAVLGRERYRSAIPRTVERLKRLLPASTQTAELSDVFHEAGLLVE